MEDSNGLAWERDKTEYILFSSLIVSEPFKEWRDLYLKCGGWWVWLKEESHPRFENDVDWLKIY